MNLNYLLGGTGHNPEHLLILRHQPEPTLGILCPWLATERPDVFNAHQSFRGEKLERAMQAMRGSGLIASFIGHEPDE